MPTKANGKQLKARVDRDLRMMARQSKKIKRGHLYVLDGHEPVETTDVMAWGKMFGDFDQRLVQRTEQDNVMVSTVFLGVNHGWGDQPPLLFETMVFGGKHNDAQERYSTWDKAEAGHRKWVAKVFGK